MQGWSERKRKPQLNPRLSQVHAHIISYLKQEMPSVFRKDNKKKSLIYQLPVIFSKIQLQHNISAGDFPDCAKMQVRLRFLSRAHLEVLQIPLLLKYLAVFPGLLVVSLNSVR